MSLLKDINILFNNIHKYEDSLQEAKLSKDILKYSDKSPQELKKLLKDSEDCFRQFARKYGGETNWTIKPEDNESYETDYNSCITYLALLLSLYNGHDYTTIRSINNLLNDINNISDTIFPQKESLQLDIRAVAQLAAAFRSSNTDLRKLFHIGESLLKEHKLSQFDTSKITDKSISEYGLNEAKLIDASFGKDSITIQFEVESTGDNTHVDLTGKTQVFLKRGYSVTIQFTKTDNYLSPTNINKDAIAQQFNSVIQNCDAKVYCDCPAFYWQGMAEKDDKQGDSYFGFRGQRGTGYWNNLHNVNGPQACKHIWSAIYFVNTEQKQICDKLASKVVNSANVYDSIINQN